MTSTTYINAFWILSIYLRLKNLENCTGEYAYSVCGHVSLVYQKFLMYDDILVTRRASKCIIYIDVSK